MGLDMYGWHVPKTSVLVDFHATNGEENKATNFAYWRKFNHLHGWMKRLYASRGGTDEDFNCSSVQLLEADLMALEEALKSPEGLPHTSGFFFGGTELYPEDVVTTRQFIVEAREQMSQGRSVFYSAWW